MNPNYKLSAGSQVTTTAPTRPRQFRMPDGTTYRIGKGGRWERTSPRRCEARDYKDLHNHGVRRRNR